jgi:VWFA-related protein
MNHRPACLASAALLCCITSIAAWNQDRQAQPPGKTQEQTFKVKTELVEIRAVVTDQRGRLVENLQREDFELLENNQPQEISFFSVSQAEGGQEKPAAASAPSQAKKPASIRDRLSALPARSTVLYVDNLHLTFRNLTWLKQNLHRFINENMTDQDAIALVTSDGSLGIAQQFTRDRQILHYAVEKIMLGPDSWETEEFTATLAGRIARGDTFALEIGKAILRREEGIDDKYGSMTRSRASQILFGASYFREATLRTLNALVEQLAGMPGQRMIAVFSEGFTQNRRDGFPIYEEVRTVINRAVRSGVVIYSIDGKGLSFEQPDPEKQDALVALAKGTGGEFYANDNGLSKQLSWAFEANRFYYVLAYYLKPGSDVRKFRNIKVRVRNHPEYRIQTPKGYSLSDVLTAKADEKEQIPQQHLVQAIKKILPVNNFNVSAQMDFFGTKDDTQQVSLTVCFDADALQYQQQDERTGFSVEILYVIYDSAGKQVDGLFTNVQGTLTPARMAQSRSNGYLFSKQLRLRPGVYQARVGVRESGTERIGTTSAWIEVPDLARNKIALSSLIFFDSPPADDENADPANQDGLKRIPMVQGVRLFSRDKICAYAFRVYRNVNSPIGSNLTMKTELLKSGKAVRQSAWLPLSGDSKDLNQEGQIYVGGKLDLAGLDPGIYELSVSIKDAGSKRIAQRTSAIGIE